MNKLGTPTVDLVSDPFVGIFKKSGSIYSLVYLIFLDLFVTFNRIPKARVLLGLQETLSLC
jgi:hypothetical protein